MSATMNSVFATAGIVTIGKWSQDEKVSVRIVVGGMFLAVGLTFLEQGNETLARRFALLVLVVATFMYVPQIAYAAGLTKRKPVKWG